MLPRDFCKIDTDWMSLHVPSEHAMKRKKESINYVIGMIKPNHCPMHPNNVLIMQHYFLMNYGSLGMERRCRRPKNVQDNEFTPFHWFLLELTIHSSTAPRSKQNEPSSRENCE